MTARLLPRRLLGQTIDLFPKGKARVFARSAHISIGALLGGVLLYRIWWRITAGERLPAARAGSLNALAKSMHMTGRGSAWLALPAALSLIVFV